MGGSTSHSESQAGPLLGRSPLIQTVIEQLVQAAPTDSTVLLQGETGTGKGVAARTIHAHSRRKHAAFIQLNCSGIPDGLIESELFGHEKGAFTGALQRRIGKVEQAAAGTLFLDEIGDMRPEAQTRLLQLLEERTYHRVGSNESRAVEARIISATHRDLQQLIEEGHFRQDLFFRLHVVPIYLPPLREHKEDIPLMMRHFLPPLAAHLGKPCPQLHLSALEILMAYDWPGNVRELRHTAERAIIACNSTEIRAEHIPLIAAKAKRQETERRLVLNLKEIERQHIQRVLQMTRGVIKGRHGAAEILGLPSSTLYNRMLRLGIRKSH